MRNDVILGYPSTTVCIRCISNHAALPFDNYITAEQFPIDCSTNNAPKTVANPIEFPYVYQGTEKVFDKRYFITLTGVVDCVETCKFGDTCAIDNGSIVASTIADQAYIAYGANGYTINAKQDSLDYPNGWTKTLCITCESAPFPDILATVVQKTFTLKQLPLICDTILTPKTTNV